MKNLKSVLIILATAGLISSCDYESRMITIYNDAEQDIIYYIPNVGEGLTSDFNRYNLPTVIEAHDSIDIITRFSTKQMFQQCYPLSVYLFDPIIVNEYGWETVMRDEMILVQYELLENDARRLDCRVSYPPNEEMKNVLMYPPYEEVIENYNRIISEKE